MRKISYINHTSNETPIEIIIQIITEIIAEIIIEIIIEIITEIEPLFQVRQSSRINHTSLPLRRPRTISLFLDYFTSDIK